MTPKLVVVDEVCSMIEDFFDDTTNSRKFEQNYHTLRAFLKNCECCVFCDAHIGTREIRLAEVFFQKEDIQVVENIYRRESNVLPLPSPGVRRGIPETKQG